MAKKAKKSVKRRSATGAKTGAKKRVTAAKKKSRRTTMYSSAGKKLYAVRDSEGKFKDIQSYQRAHSQDIKRKATDES